MICCYTEITKKKCTYIYTKKSKEWVAFEDTSELRTDANSIGKCHDLYLVGLIEPYTIFEKNEIVNRVYIYTRQTRGFGPCLISFTDIINLV